MKTKGALLWELNSPFRVDEIEVGDPVADEVQIRVHAAGMCHSDYHLTTGATPIALPALGGHEGAGVVTKVGKNVTGLDRGRPRHPRVHPGLRRVPAVPEGLPVAVRPRRAAARRQGDRRRHRRACTPGSTEVSPMNLLGTFAPYMTVHKDSVVKIDPDIPFESAAIMGCAVPTGLRIGDQRRPRCSPARPSSSSASAASG